MIAYMYLHKGSPSEMSQFDVKLTSERTNGKNWALNICRSDWFPSVRRQICCIFRWLTDLKVKWRQTDYWISYIKQICRTAPCPTNQQSKCQNNVCSKWKICYDTACLFVLPVKKVYRASNTTNISEITTLALHACSTTVLLRWLWHGMHGTSSPTISCNFCWAPL